MIFLRNIIKHHQNKIRQMIIVNKINNLIEIVGKKIEGDKTEKISSRIR